MNISLWTISPRPPLPLAFTWNHRKRGSHRITKAGRKEGLGYIFYLVPQHHYTHLTVAVFLYFQTQKMLGILSHPVTDLWGSSNTVLSPCLFKPGGDKGLQLFLISGYFTIPWRVLFVNIPLIKSSWKHSSIMRCIIQLLPAGPNRYIPYGSFAGSP